MTKSHSTDLDRAESTSTASPDSSLPDAVTDLIDRGRAVLGNAPDAAGGARDALMAAQGQVEELSDMGVTAVAAFSLGVTGGLLLAGAPRIILVLSAIPGVMATRVAFRRGVRPTRLVH